jgi:hypothetical protein
MKIGGMSNQTAIYLTDEEAELYKEFCRQYDIYALIIRRVLDSPGGNVTLHTDEKGMIRSIQTSRTWIV